MADLNKAAPAQDAATASRYIDPFGEGSPTLSWTSKINMAQFIAELTETLPGTQIVAYLPQDDESGEEVPVDATHPYVFFLSPPSTDLTAVRQVLASHRPNPYFGMTDDERQQQQIVTGLREKVAAGEDLTDTDIQQALRLLLS